MSADRYGVINMSLAMPALSRKRTVILLLCLTSSGCGLFADDPDLVAVTDVTPDSFALGDSVLVRIVVTNRGEEPQNISVKTCPEPFRVIDRAGRVVGPVNGVCTADLQQRGLEPGESYTFNRFWRGDGNPVEGSKSVPAGTYTVEGYFGSRVESHGATVTRR